MGLAGLISCWRWLPRGSRSLGCGDRGFVDDSRWGAECPQTWQCACCWRAETASPGWPRANSMVMNRRWHAGLAWAATTQRAPALVSGLGPPVLCAAQGTSRRLGGHSVPSTANRWAEVCVGSGRVGWGCPAAQPWFASLAPRSREHVTVGHGGGVRPAASRAGSSVK